MSTIGFDIEGTLVDRDLYMSQMCMLHLRKLEVSGAYLFLASGRSMESIVALTETWGIAFRGLVAENGAIMKVDDQLKINGDPRHEGLEKFSRIASREFEKSGKIVRKTFGWGIRIDGHDIRMVADKCEEIVVRHELNLKVSVNEAVGSIDVVQAGYSKASIIQSIPKAGPVHYIGDSDNDLPVLLHPEVIPHTVANGSATVKSTVMRRGGIVASNASSDGVAEILTILQL